VGSVHQGPINRNGNEIGVARADLARALKRVVEAEISPESPFAEREIVALAAADEATREYCERELQMIADGHDDELLIDGVHNKRCHEPARGLYHSLCGTLQVQRALYLRVGERNGPTVVPLEFETGLVERATPALAYSIALDRSLMHSRAIAESAAAKHRHFPSRTTIEHIGLALARGRLIRPWRRFSARCITDCFGNVRRDALASRRFAPTAQRSLRDTKLLADLRPAMTVK